MTAFADALAAHGIVPRSTPQPDGRVHRCPTAAHPRSRNGAYHLASDGAFGWYQDWARDAEAIIWTADAREHVVAPYDPRPLREAWEKRRREQAEASRGAWEFFSACAPLLGGHPYLAAKNLTMRGCRGLRCDADGWLVVPLLSGRKLRSVQRIAPAGDKRFWPGAPVSGCAYALRREGATLTVLCEGLATALALYAAVQMARIVVAFTAGNLERVAEQVPALGMVVVAADNDHGTAERIGENPGLKAAEKAAAVLGCGVAVPQGIVGTDFADLRQERVAARLASKAYGRWTSEGRIRQEVDAQIQAELLKYARFAPLATRTA